MIGVAAEGHAIELGDHGGKPERRGQSDDLAEGHDHLPQHIEQRLEVVDRRNRLGSHLLKRHPEHGDARRDRLKRRRQASHHLAIDDGCGFAQSGPLNRHALVGEGLLDAIGQRAAERIEARDVREIHQNGLRRAGLGLELGRASFRRGGSIRRPCTAQRHDEAPRIDTARQRCSGGKGFCGHGSIFDCVACVCKLGTRASPLHKGGAGRRRGRPLFSH